MIVFGKRQAHSTSELLQSMGYTSIVMQNPSEYLSLTALTTYLEKDTWNRKETILILKLLFWREDTQTGNLSELKLYGEERKEIEFFRMSPGEHDSFYDALIARGGDTDVIIHDAMRQREYPLTGRAKLILKDIALLEEAIRRNNSIHIGFDELMAICDELSGLGEMRETLAWLEALYLSFPTRPTGPAVSPPGNYGETYFLTQ